MSVIDLDLEKEIIHTTPNIKMNTLLILNETITNGLRVAVLDFISIASIASGILTIISKNPIVSVLFLIGLFFGLACYLIVLGISFIGLSYLLVYVGAVSILFIFILMLINVRISELYNNTSNIIPLALLTSISFANPFYELLPYNIWTSFENSIYKYYPSYERSPFFVTSSLWDGSLSESTHITSLGNIMYTSYSIWLIIASIILLLAMIGAIVITIKQKTTF